MSDIDTGQPPEPQPPVGPTWTRSAGGRRAIVDQLLAVPGMSEPAFRQQLYNQLPNPIVNQLNRHDVARLELAALVTSFDHYPDLDPWRALAEAVTLLAPDYPAVHTLIRTLGEHGLIDRHRG